VTNIILNKTGGKYTAAKSAGRFSGIKMYLAGVDIEDKGAFSHLSGNCKEIDPCAEMLRLRLLSKR